MKKTISILCCAVLLLCCIFPNCTAETVVPWQQAYRSILNESLTQWEQMRNDAAVENSYALWDMDRDSIPELILKNGTCEADYRVLLYTFRDSSVVKIDEIGAGHCSFYGDGAGDGLIAYWGHMGYAQADRYRITDHGLQDEFIFEDNLNPRLESDPDAEYLPLTDFVPEARYLTFVEAYNPLLLEQYEAVLAALGGSFSTPAASRFPQDDEKFFLKVISGSVPVIASPIDRFANAPGAVLFRDLLQKDVASPWMSGNLEIRNIQTADLNSDGQLECILDLSCADGSNPMRFYLSEQDGTVYVYLQNYTYDSQTVDASGNLITVYSYDSEQSSLSRLFFDRENAFLLSLPASFGAP